MATNATKAAISAETIKSLEEEFMSIQDKICDHLEQVSGQAFTESLWSYDKDHTNTKSGGGRTRCVEVNRRQYLDTGGWQLKPEEERMPFFEKGACNFSGISGPSMPRSAVDRMSLPPNTPFHATGVSLIFHPSNPQVPTIHMNVRFFCCGDKWWFGGGVDVTPYYPVLSQVIQFHTELKKLCDEFGQDYGKMKKECDQYFYLQHRRETRGVGGLFYDGMTGDFDAIRKFTMALGRKFTDLYDIFLDNAYRTFTEEERLFQLYRRGRYVEFNLCYDRGTKFGLASDGRAESILVSLPSTVHWVYDYTPPPNTKEAYLYKFFLQEQDWLNLSEDMLAAMQPPQGMSYGGSPSDVAVTNFIPEDEPAGHCNGRCCGSLCLSSPVGLAVHLVAGAAVAYTLWKKFS